jgi:putative SOS response-associated peptidase YedK
MPGRFTLTVSPETLFSVFGVRTETPLPPRYNIAPTQNVAAIRQNPRTGVKELDFLHWGLIPSWAKDRTVDHCMINARSETVHEKPSFKYDLHHHRCLIPASGFYEWVPEGGKKMPLYIHLKKNELMVFAGLWDHWQSPDGTVIESCTILTTRANALLQPIHERMPVILDPRDLNLWLNPVISEIERLKYLFDPYPAEKMAMHPVSEMVNSTRNDTPECILPVGR